jgi:hypothetical protein
MKKWLTVLALLLAFLSNTALQRSDLLFYAGLNGQANADLARGDAAPTRAKNPTFEEGVRGKGLLGTNPVQWDAAGNMRGKEGTISFWLKPVDWSSGDGNNHMFARWGTENGNCRLYQYYPGQTGFLMQPAEGGTAVCWDYASFKKGKWRHMAFTWRQGEWTLYMDGYRREQVSDKFVPFGKVKALSLGGDNTVFDELMVFGRALSEEEVQALYYRIKRPKEDSNGDDE